MITAAYHPQHREPAQEHEPTAEEVAHARHAYELLGSWHILPGSDPVGAPDATALGT